MEQMHDSAATSRRTRVLAFLAGWGEQEEEGETEQARAQAFGVEEVPQASRSPGGPLPPPAVLKQYDDLVPGSAERIFQMSEKALDHQIDFRRAGLTADVVNTKRGQVLVFAVVVIVLAYSAIALYTGHASMGQLLGGGTVISLAAIFVLGRLPGWLKSFGKPSE